MSPIFQFQKEIKTFSGGYKHEFSWSQIPIWATHRKYNCIDQHVQYYVWIKFSGSRIQSFLATLPRMTKLSMDLGSIDRTADTTKLISCSQQAVYIFLKMFFVLVKSSFCALLFRDSQYLMLQYFMIIQEKLITWRRI